MISLDWSSARTEGYPFLLSFAPPHHAHRAPRMGECMRYVQRSEHPEIELAGRSLANTLTGPWCQQVRTPYAVLPEALQTC